MIGLSERQLINRMLVACLIFSAITVLVTGGLILSRGEVTAAQDIDAGLEEISKAAELESDSDCLVIPLPEEVDSSDVEIEALPEEKRVNLLINKVDSNFYYDNPLGGSGEQIEKILYGYEDGMARIVLLTRAIYCCNAEVDEGKLRLDFKRPRDIYDTIVVVNPAHGSDTGTVAYGYDECTVDHELADVLFEELSSAGMGVYIAEDENAAELAEELEADVFISLHCDGDVNTRTTTGPSIEYVRDDTAGKKLAVSIGDGVRGSKWARKVSVGIYDGRRALPTCCTAVIFKAGYLTNYEEATRLADKEYLRQLAVGIAEGMECLE